MKRDRGPGDVTGVLESYAALLRQSTSRAVDRLRLQRVNQTHQQRASGPSAATTTVRPIDVLVIEYCMYYLDLRQLPSTHYMRLAQEIVTGSPERVFLPRYFAKVPSLPQLCESLVEENTAAVMQSTLTEVEAFVEAREAIAEWISEQGSAVVARASYAVKDEDEERSGSDDAGLGNDTESTVDLAALLYESMEFWVRVHTFVHAMAEGNAQMNAHPLHPRYERELMGLLHTLVVAPHRAARQDGNVAAPTSPEAGLKPEHVVKDEPDDAASPAVDQVDDTATGADLVTAVLGDALALANCPVDARVPAATPWDGTSAAFYAMVHARLAVMVTRDRLHRFGRRAVHPPPELTPSQQRLLETEQARQAEQQQQQSAALGGLVGVPLDYVPDDRYFSEILQQQNDFIGEDEELYKDEVVDYYLRRSAAAQQGSTGQESASASRPPETQRGRRPDAHAAAAQELVKPHRFCKVKTGFTWTQYNRTHYDSRTNPPPRMVMWYEFTLFYPALVHTKRDMRHIFHIEDTPRGPGDDYCLLVFSVGPPYADVAYRIVKKQWDTRRGGVRISFDATGKYKLFFRFASSNYRR